MSAKEQTRLTFICVSLPRPDFVARWLAILSVKQQTC